MEKLNLNYSLKNIPIPPRLTYKTILIEKIESALKRMRWKAHFFLNPDASSDSDSNNYGFKSRACPPRMKEMDSFECDLFSIVNNITFRRVNDPFQAELKRDIEKIKASDNVFLFADKTTNLYEISPAEHKKLLKENITKTYKKAPEKLEAAINSEAKQIATKLEMADRIERLAKNESFITVKDHKEDFRTSPSCRLINPCKPELGKVSKSIIETINKILCDTLQYNQWKNTDDVIKWFKNINDKSSCSFIQFDIKEFYPSITEKILDNAVSFAREHVAISTEQLRIIKHCRKSLLFNENEAWKKKNTHESFDVTMGSFDGAELCELVGLHILSKLNEKSFQGNVGLYRDDGLMYLRNCNGRQCDKTRKDIIKLFTEIGFQLDIHSNLKVVDYLDVTFNLNNSTYCPYKKPNDKLKYINVSSNHPPQIIKQLPDIINDRLSANSSNKEIFDKSKADYEKGLRESGYNPNLNFQTRPKAKRKRNRKIIWFNPPFNKSVSTNIAKKFLLLLDKHFPRNNPLHKIFNRNNVKVSYSCTENISKIIKRTSKNKMKAKKDVLPKCNCRDRNHCPLDGNCQVESVVYKCVASTLNETDKAYIGLTEGTWKQRSYKHSLSFRNKKYENSTTLSKHVWEQKLENRQPNLKWSILATAPAYSNISKRCLLCLREKIEIISYPIQENLLNKRSELISKCRHQNKFLMKNYDSKD